MTITLKGGNGMKLGKNIDGKDVRKVYDGYGIYNLPQTIMTLC